MLRLALMSIVLLTGGCLGIEGTDVSTGAAPSSEGDDGFTTLTATAGDATNSGTTDPASTDPSDTGDEGPLTATDTQGQTTEGDETTGAQPTDSSGEGADSTSESSSGTGDIDTDGTGTGTGTDTGTESGSSDSGSGSTGDTCGDGEVQVSEQCDGDDLQGFDCQSLGLPQGVLACDPVTCVFDVSQCGQ